MTIQLTKMTHSEAGKLGSIVSTERWKQKKKENIAKYETSPKKCGACGKMLSYEKRKNNFCNHSCAAYLNNFSRNRKHNVFLQSNFKDINDLTGRPKFYLCLYCGKEKKFTINSKNKFCNSKCQSNYAWEVKKKAFLKDGFWVGITHERSLSRLHKRLLKEQDGCKCSICGYSEWMGQAIPLILDHIDGHSENYSLLNLRLVCGNCDMQLPTYKGKNRGNGRYSRRQRYREGKSY